MDNRFMRAYTIKEVSKKINVPPGTIRQWEKDLDGILFISRTKQGARYFTDQEISLLMKIKEMRDKNLSKEMIRELLQKHLNQNSEADSETIETSMLSVSENNTPEHTENSDPRFENFLEAMEAFKENLLEEIKGEIRNTARKEILEEVKKEISKSTVHTVKSLSHSIYTSSEKTKSEIQDLSGRIAKASEHNSEEFKTLKNSVAKASKLTSETFRTLSNSIAKVSEDASEEIAILSNRLSESSEASAEEFKTLVHYISKSTEVTNHEINNLINNINKDRDILLETLNQEREQYLQEIKHREAAFQDLISGFRNAAADEEKPAKKWWRPWKKQ